MERYLKLYDVSGPNAHISLFDGQLPSRTIDRLDYPNEWDNAIAPTWRADIPAYFAPEREPKMLFEALPKTREWVERVAIPFAKLYGIDISPGTEPGDAFHFARNAAWRSSGNNDDVLHKAHSFLLATVDGNAIA